MAPNISKNSNSTCKSKTRQINLLLFSFLLFGFGLNEIKAQPTALAAGDIAFSGYRSYSIQDSFSFVLLKAVNAGTLINFTDNGWINPGVFRTGETHFTLTTIALPAGREIKIFHNYSIPATVAVQSENNASAGTVTYNSGPYPFSLSELGDQIIAYQGSVASPTIIAAIHMNVYSRDFNPSDCGNTTSAAWDPVCRDGAGGTIGNENFSLLPTGLYTGLNCVWIGNEGEGESEFDNARFNACGLDLSTAALARAALNNKANWGLKNNGALGFNISSRCTFMGTSNGANPPQSITLLSDPGTTSQTVCYGTAINDINYLPTFHSLYSWITLGTGHTLPAGVSPAFNGYTFKITGTPWTPGIFNYKIIFNGDGDGMMVTGTIKVNGVTGGVVVLDQTIPSGGDPVEFTETVASTGTGILSYQWQSSTTNCTSGFSNIGGATGSTYDPPQGLTQTTYYRRVTTSTFNCNLACTANSNCITVTFSPALPVEIIDFTGKLNSDKTVTLQWKVADQQDAQEFIVEESADGSFFKTLGSVTPGAGDSYSLNDALVTIGNNYYRLKIIELSGKIIYSKIIIINLQAGITASLFPNPVTNKLTIQQFGTMHYKTAALIDAKGSILQQIKLTNPQQPVNMEIYPAGVYMLKMDDGNVFKVVKQ